MKLEINITNKMVDFNYDFMTGFSGGLITGALLIGVITYFLIWKELER